MLVGLVSDTHDNEAEAAYVAAFFRAQGVEQAFHLGDVTQPETLAPFAGIPLVVVRGNNDEEPWPDSWRQELAGVRVGATHGHDRSLLRGLVESCELVLHGHTHQRRVERVGGALVVNPGALHRAPMHTCALLELPSLRVTSFRVDATGVRRL